MKLTVKANVSDLISWRKNVTKTIEKTSTRTIKKALSLSLKLIRKYGPYDYGYFLDGFKPKQRTGKRKITGKLDWKETKKARQTSFAKTKWKNFENWIVNSPHSQGKFPWKKTTSPFYRELVLKDLRKQLPRYFKAELKNK